MGDKLADVWVYLAQTPLLWLTLTLLVYVGVSRIYVRFKSRPLFHPLNLSVLVLVPLLMLTHTPYEVYFDGAQFVHFLLGPATVALAVPLYQHSARVRQMLLPLGGALLVGSATGILSAVLIGRMLGASLVVQRSLAAKSITTPIAIGVSEQLGGLPSLTTVLVILTGIIGAIAAKWLLDLLRIRAASARGFAIGLASHGLGTATAFQMDEESGAFSGLAMGLNGAVTAILAPLLARLIGL